MFIMLSKRHLLAILVILAIIIVGLSAVLSSASSQVISWAVVDKTIVIDAGHGGIFPGKISSDGTEEKDVNLAIAQYLQKYLTQSGCETIMTRTSDTQLSSPETSEQSLLAQQRDDLAARTAIATNVQADYFISIHCNSIPSAQWHGAQVFYRPDDEESMALAQTLQKTLTDQLKNTDRQAIVREDTYLFENLTMPAVIIECGFLSNPDEAELLKDDLYQQKIAHAIYLGISDYFAQN